MPIDSVPQPAIDFGGVPIGGIVEIFNVPPPATQLYRRHFSGVFGESELRGAIGGRTIEVGIVIADGFATREALTDFYETDLNIVLMQQNATLVYNAPDYVREYNNCTFEGFHPSPRGPLEDEAGTLDGGWYIRGVLVFRQLRVG
jgi:hypothetical protein